MEVLCLDENYDFICLSETHLTNDIDDGEIVLKNYNVLRCNSSSTHTGGVCFYIRNNWKFKLVESIAIDRMIWWLKVEIENKNLKYYLIGVYRSPDKQKSPEREFLNFFEEETEKIESSDHYLIIGDFNINWYDNDLHKKRLEEIINDNYLKQIVAQPTRITSTTATLIDYVVTNIVDITAKTNFQM